MRGFAAFICLILLSISPASALSVTKSKKVAGWDAIVGQTKNSGKTCQARKCKGGCSPSATISLHLWGSHRRKAITPLIGLYANYARGTKATVLVGNKKFRFHKSRKKRTNKFLPVRANDDKRFIKALQAGNANTLTIKIKVDSYKLNIGGIGSAIKYVKANCGIRN